MKLINYLLETDKGIDTYEMAASFHEMEVEDYIKTGYCPSAFTIFINTVYGKPLVTDKKHKEMCKYSLLEDQDKCNECWSRNILVVAK